MRSRRGRSMPSSRSPNVSARGSTSRLQRARTCAPAKPTTTLNAHTEFHARHLTHSLSNRGWNRFSARNKRLLLTRTLVSLRGGSCGNFVKRYRNQWSLYWMKFPACFIQTRNKIYTERILTFAVVDYSLISYVLFRQIFIISATLWCQKGDLVYKKHYLNHTHPPTFFILSLFLPIFLF